MTDSLDGFYKSTHEAIRLGQPPNAKFYALLRLGGAGAERYPAAPGTFSLVAPWQPPLGVPSGRYLVLYYSEQTGKELPWSAARPYPTVMISWPEGSNAAAKGTLPSPSDKSESPTLNSLVQKFREDARLLNDPEVREAQIEYVKREAALRLQSRTQRLLRDGQYTKEVGESFTLVSAYRQETQELIETAATITKRASEQVLSMAEQVRELTSKSLAESAEALKKFAVPPPPPDYTGPLTALVGLARDVSVALIQSRSGNSASLAASPADAPQPGVVQAALVPQPRPSPGQLPSGSSEPSLSQPSSTAPSGTSMAPEPPLALVTPHSESPALAASTQGAMPALSGESPTAPNAISATPTTALSSSTPAGARTPSTAPVPMPNAQSIPEDLVHAFASADTGATLGPHLQEFLGALKAPDAGAFIPPPSVAAPVPVRPSALGDLPQVAGPTVPTLVDPNDEAKRDAARRFLAQFASADEAVLVLLTNPEILKAWKQGAP